MKLKVGDEVKLLYKDAYHGWVDWLIIGKAYKVGKVWRKGVWPNDLRPIGLIGLEGKRVFYVPTCCLQKIEESHQLLFSFMED